MKAEAKQIEKIKIRVSGQQLTHAKTGLHTHNQACVRKQDYSYADSCLETLKTPKIGQNLKTGILTTLHAFKTHKYINLS